MARVAFVQWLRVLLIALVVAHHAGQPYGPTGGSWPIADPVNADWLGPFFGVNAAFFMGFFFLLAGYFTGSSYDRKGPAAFARDRLMRLGIPLLVFAFIVFPVVIYARTKPAAGPLEYYFGDYIGGWHIEMGHLWFVAQLLVYSLLYLLWRLYGPRHMAGTKAVAAPGDRTILIYTVLLAVTAVLVRLVYPQDVWVRVLWVVPAEPAHLPQYVSLFVIGIVAGYGRWLESIPIAVGVRWFLIGFVAFVIAGIASGQGDRLPVDFGVVWGFLEAFICVGMILGLTVLFRSVFNRPGRLVDVLDANVYGVYLVHWLIVVAVQAAILTFDWSATAKFFFVAIVALILSFALSAALRALPLTRRVL